MSPRNDSRLCALLAALLGVAAAARRLVPADGAIAAGRLPAIVQASGERPTDAAPTPLAARGPVERARAGHRACLGRRDRDAPVAETPQSISHPARETARELGVNSLSS